MAGRWLTPVLLSIPGPNARGGVLAPHLRRIT
jgi:hypothetical protein